jgi:MFS family permease
MHQMVSANLGASRRWWVLAIVVAAQFMFGVDAFIVNVAIPTIAAELHASPAQVESVIAIYLIAYATLIVTGGRLGDIYGTKPVFLTGVFGFTVTSLWCALAQSGAELIEARLAQGATAALMVPQVLATLHLLFSDHSRSRAFAIYGIVLGLAGAAGFLLGGVLVTLDIAGVGWRAVFPCQRAFRARHHRRRFCHHAFGAAASWHAARHVRRHRAVYGLVVPDRAVAVRS